MRASTSRRAWILVLALFLALAPGARADIAMVLSKVSGKVEMLTAASPDWQPATAGVTLRPEDKVRTSPDGAARVSYPDAELSIAPESTAVLGYTSVRMQVGTLWVRMRKSGRTFEIMTPTVAVTIRGTLVRAAAGPGGSAVHLLTGIVDVKVGGKVDRLEPRMQLDAPQGAAAMIGKIEPGTLTRLMAEYSALSVGAALPAGRVGPPPPKGGSGGSGSSGSGASGSSGSSSSGRPDSGQQALSSGLASVEKDLDARSTGLSASGGSDRAFDSAGGGGRTSGSSGGGSAGAGASTRSLISRPGGVAPMQDIASLGGGAGAGGGAGGGSGGGSGDTGTTIGAPGSGGVGGDMDGDDGGRGRGRGRFFRDGPGGRGRR